MTTGAELRALRRSARMSLNDLAARCYLSKSYLSLVETGHRPVTGTVLAEYERALGVGVAVVNRRTFFSAAAAAVTVADLSASLAGGDPGPLGMVQTSNAVDHAIAAATTRPVWKRLERWASDEDSAIVRVNAVGILAKAPGQSAGTRVAEVLQHDHEVRELYMSAVVSRVLNVDHQAGAAYAAAPDRLPCVQLAAQRLAVEAIAPNDAGARWCASTMLARMAPYLGRK